MLVLKNCRTSVCEINLLEKYAIGESSEEQLKSNWDESLFEDSEGDKIFRVDGWWAIPVSAMASIEADKVPVLGEVCPSVLEGRELGVGSSEEGRAWRLCDDEGAGDA